MRISREQQMRAAEEMFKQLDPKDGKTNQKIDASVWNKFVKDVVGEGKEIKTSIDKEHALRSIRTYLARQNADESTLKKWNEGIKGMEIEKPDAEIRGDKDLHDKLVSTPDAHTDFIPKESELRNPKQSVQPKQPAKLTAAEAKAARAYGSNVADYLVGYTTNAEAGLTREVITKQVNDKNVMEFLRGYENNRGMGNSFFTQLHTEYGFGDKDWNQQDAMVNVANKALSYIKKHGGSSTDLKEISIILKDHSFTLEEARKMDRIVSRYLPKNV